jgi:hypothetical protein
VKVPAGSFEDADAHKLTLGGVRAVHSPRSRDHDPSYEGFVLRTTGVWSMGERTGVHVVAQGSALDIVGHVSTAQIVVVDNARKRKDPL